MMTTTQQRKPLAERLADPHTEEMLHRLLDRAEGLDKALEAAGELPNLIAIGADFFDALVRQAAEDGVDLEDRAGKLLGLLRQLTEPAQLQALTALTAMLPTLAEGGKLGEELPNLLATAMDVFDEWARSLKEDGIDLEESVRRGLHAALYLGGRIREEELDRIGYLLRSDVLSEQAVETVGIAGSALSRCRTGTCDQPVPPRLGLFGALKVLSDPNAQRALSFGMQFAKCFGAELGESHPRRNDA